MQPFDYNKYLKNNPLLKEGINEASEVYTDWREYVNPDYILVTLKNGKKLKIEKKRIQGGQKVYQAILQAFNDEKHALTDKVVDAMIKQLGEGQLNEAMGNQFAEAALELVTLAKSLIRAAGESLVMNSEVKKASMVTDEDGLSELFYHLQDVLGEFIGSGARTFAREAKKIIVGKYGITMTDEYGFPMKWMEESINESTKTAQTLKSTKPGDKLTLVLDDGSTATVVRVGTDKRGEPTFKHIKNNKEVGTASALSASHIKSIK